MTPQEAKDLMTKALEAGYTPTVTINGEYYEVK